MEDDNDLDESARCVAFMQAQKQHEMHYLSEGTHAFSLKDGRAFTVYASPYKPDFNDCAFAYGQHKE
jgi:hypothetical protein